MSKMKTAKPTTASLDKLNAGFARAVASGDYADAETPGTEVTVVEHPTLVLSDLQIAVRDARTLHRRLRQDFFENLMALAEQIVRVKAEARKAKVPYATLFGDPDDETKFSFSHGWANNIVRIYESRAVIEKYRDELPADINALSTFVSVTDEEEREDMLGEYEELMNCGTPRKGITKPVQGELLPRDADLDARYELDLTDKDNPESRPLTEPPKRTSPQKAMKQAKKNVVMDVSPKSRSQPKAAPDGDLDVEALVRAFVADNALTTPQISIAVTVLKRIMEECK